MKLMYEIEYEPLPEGITALFDQVAQACKRTEGIEGDYFNVVGLPVSALYRLLLDMGVPLEGSAL